MDEKIGSGKCEDLHAVIAEVAELDRWDACFIDDAIGRIAEDEKDEFLFEGIGQSLQRHYQQVCAFERALHRLGAEDQDFFVPWYSKDAASEVFIDRLINFRVDAVWDVADIESGKHALSHEVAQPFARGDDRELRALVGMIFESPLDGCRVALDSGFGERVGALAAAGLPSFAVEACVAVAGDRPHVVECEDGGFVGGDVRQGEVAQCGAVGAVDVDEIGGG